MNRQRRSLPGRLAAGLLIPLLAAGGAAAQGAAKTVVDVRIENRRVVAPQGAIRVVQGDVVELRWRTDEPAEIHLHGYDKELRVRPGKPASMSVTARATGRFPITSHGWGANGHGHGHDVLTYLEVYPR